MFSKHYLGGNPAREEKLPPLLHGMHACRPTFCALCNISEINNLSRHCSLPGMFSVTAPTMPVMLDSTLRNSEYVRFMRDKTGIHWDSHGRPLCGPHFSSRRCFL